ncbi:hypothetical protein DU48_12820 [Methanosarcina mazei]|uniref:Uncharacterized protein n=1 Tax=Methanosarcina mazei TaxID=2209 RepID=A0A0F8HJ00_METMZ|nr:hypothetical protein DU63_18975 [Methanosarcina mazei]KKH16078.1 hypothetical protein DU48_12820 [Methanosarcina mazei]KKH20317.1 hypothetical protein DU44_06245 [Methanosarcina mazei]
MKTMICRDFMFDIFKNMVKEEWRMHSSLFGHRGFALFPVFITKGAQRVTNTPSFRVGMK